MGGVMFTHRLGRCVAARPSIDAIKSLVFRLLVAFEPASTFGRLASSSCFFKTAAALRSSKVPRLFASPIQTSVNITTGSRGHRGQCDCFLLLLGPVPHIRAVRHQVWSVSGAEIDINHGV